MTYLLLFITSVQHKFALAMLWQAAYVLQSVFDSRQFSIGTGMQCEAPQFAQKSFFEWEWIGFLLPELSYCYESVLHKMSSLKNKPVLHRGRTRSKIKVKLCWIVTFLFSFFLEPNSSFSQPQFVIFMLLSL